MILLVLTFKMTVVFGTIDRIFLFLFFYGCLNLWKLTENVIVSREHLEKPKDWEFL